MAEVSLFEGVKVKNNLIGAHADMKVWLWDCGPEEPDLPEPPEAPSGKDGEPKYDLAKIVYKRQLRAYEAALEKFEVDTAAFAKWKRECGGPMEKLQWSCDARDTLKADAKAVAEKRQSKPRWYVSARTRGYEHLKNGGLPIGVKPGHGHQADLKRQVEADAALAAAARRDPVFGEEIRA